MTDAQHRTALVDSIMASRMLGVTEGTLKQWRHHNRGPAFVRVGRAVRYQVGDIEDFIEARRVVN